jgi:hypothetical protein
MKVIEVAYLVSKRSYSEIDEGFGQLSSSHRNRFLEYAGLEAVSSFNGYGVSILALDEGELIRFYKDSDGEWTWEGHLAEDLVPSGSYVGSIPAEFTATFDPSDDCCWESDVISASDGKEFRFCGDGFDSLLEIGLTGKRRPMSSKLEHLLRHPDTLEGSVAEINEELDAEEREHYW